MEQYAETVDDKELKVKIKMVEKYGHKIPNLVAAIHAKSVKNLSDADIVLTTAHKSKGLEFENVYLTDDFVDMFPKIDEETKLTIEPEREEINLLYVAITRAEKSLSVSDKLVSWFKAVGLTDIRTGRDEELMMSQQTYSYGR